MDVLRDWDLTAEELSEIVPAHPSLRGFLFGYVAEHKLRNLLFSGPKFGHVIRYDNHDRGRKGDISFTYKGAEIRVEVKSLQTASIKKTEQGLTGNAQCDASDRREVVLPNRRKVETTCLVVGTFDLLAVNVFEFTKKWVFAFARNADLPRTKSAKYAAEEQKYLLATSIPITWPLSSPFTEDPLPLLDRIAKEKKGLR